MGAYDVIMIMFIAFGLGFFYGGFIPKCVVRWQRGLLTALTCLILMAVIATEGGTFASTWKHPGKESQFPTLACLLICEQIAVAA